MARGSRGPHEAGRRWPLQSVVWTSCPGPGPGPGSQPSRPHPAPALCAPLHPPAPPPPACFGSPLLPQLSLFRSALFSPSSLLPSVCVRLPFLCAPFPSLYLPAPPPASLFLSFLISGCLLGLSVCLSPGCACPPCRPVPVSSLPGLVCLPVALPVSPPAFREGSHDLRAADRASCGCGRP